MPSGLLPSRSVGPEPGMINRVARGFPAGVNRVPLSGPSGPGASIGLAAGAATTSAAAARTDAITFMTIPFIRYLGKYQNKGGASSPYSAQQAIDHGRVAAAEQPQVQQGREKLIDFPPFPPARRPRPISLPEGIGRRVEQAEHRQIDLGIAMIAGRVDQGGK